MLIGSGRIIYAYSSLVKPPFGRGFQRGNSANSRHFKLSIYIILRIIHFEALIEMFNIMAIYIILYVDALYANGLDVEHLGLGFKMMDLEDSISYRLYAHIVYML